MHNNTSIILGVVAGLFIGGFGGYAATKNFAGKSYEKEVAAMMLMMMEDGARMEKAGGMMIDAGKLLQKKGATYKDDAMVLMGKDLEVNGKQHQANGKSMMDMDDMMGMTADDAMDDVPGMNAEMDETKEMDGMDHDMMQM